MPPLPWSGGISILLMTGREIKRWSILLWPYHHHPWVWYTVRVFRLYAEASTPLQANSPVFKGSRYLPLDKQHITTTIHHLLQNTQHNHQYYISDSFRSGATTMYCCCSWNIWLAHNDFRKIEKQLLPKYTYTTSQQCYNQYQQFQPTPISLTQTQKLLTNKCYCSYGMFSMLIVLHLVIYFVCCSNAVAPNAWCFVCCSTYMLNKIILYAALYVWYFVCCLCVALYAQYFVCCSKLDILLCVAQYAR